MMQSTIYPPVLAVAMMVCLAICESSLPAFVCWTLVAVSISVILFWKFSVRGAVRDMPELNMTQNNLSTLMPLAVVYIASLPILGLAFAAIWYFNLGLLSFLILVCIWSLRKELFAIMLTRRLVVG